MGNKVDRNKVGAFVFGFHRKKIIRLVESHLKMGYTKLLATSSSNRYITIKIDFCCCIFWETCGLEISSEKNIKEIKKNKIYSLDSFIC